ncbi:MAG: hypothetical protein NTY08_16725 [Proteobacteria bacterium]|nr:hypothetical protein [Pseudomonadota bacterium]
MDQKIININTEALKEKATNAAKSAASVARERVSVAADFISSKTKDVRGKALGSILNKGIAISERQLKTLKDVKSKLS